MTIKNPITPKTGYIVPTRFEKPIFANGIADIQNRDETKVLFLFWKFLFINPNPLANAVVNIAIQRITAYIFL